jgi:UDP-N-acetylmuramate--alanine ligase
MEGVKHIDFIGIGGIGMSALARWALAQGITVTGYDKTHSPLLDLLVAEGAKIRYSEQLVDWAIPADAWVVYTPAIPKEHPQLLAAKSSTRRVFKRAELLGIIANSGRCIAVAGTHGKTTTSSLLAWIFHQAGIPVQAFLGGISSNLGSNFLPGPAEITVVEADEFDRSFLQSAFHTFANQCQTVFASSHAHLNTEYSYGLGEEIYRAEDIRIENGRQVFTLILDHERIENVVAGLPGLHNIENAVAASCLARHAGLSLPQIATGISSFTGVQRRFERVFESDEGLYLDDYAHHPTEIKRLLEAVRSLYPSRTIAVLFQPHLFSRTRDFLQGFQRELQAADTVGILPIYAAREEALPGITAEALAAGIPGAHVVSYSDGASWLSQRSESVKITVGAGDIDRLIPSIVDHLKKAIA